MIQIYKEINTYRAQIMGLATLGVIFVHSIGIVDWNPMIRKICSFGGIGVYIFVFLSAVGLYNSLKTRGGGYSKSEFYKRRSVRVIIPYALIAGTWYGIYDLLIQGRPLLFLYDFSTFSFWLDHKGAWYVAMLIPVYIAFPWFYDWAEEKNRKIRVMCSFCVAVTLCFAISLLLPDLYNHLVQVFSSIIVFLIGYYFAEQTVCSNNNGFAMSMLCLLLFAVKAASPLKGIDFYSNLSWAMLGIPVLFFSALFFRIIHCRWINSLLGFFGRLSLEMYLWNIFTIQALQYFKVIDALKSHGDTHGYIAYGIVVANGILLSVLYGKLSTSVAKRYVTK